MREADDTLIAKARLPVDSRDSTIGHIGELAIPIANGVIAVYIAHACAKTSETP